jgi:hypothetical protein
MAFKKTMIMATAALLAAGAVGGLVGGGLAVARQDRSEPGVRLASEVVASASAFEHYTRVASAISPRFGGGGHVASALAEGAAYKPEQIEAGMIAYGAIAALQEAAFIDGVRDTARGMGREALVGRLLVSPEAVVEIDGAGQAAARAKAALAERGGSLGQAGRAVKQSAYDIQHDSWSKGLIEDNAGRLDRVKRLSATPFSPSDDDAGRLIQAAAGARDGYGQGGALTPITTRSAALAALAVLGAAGDEDVARLTPVLSDRKANFCMKMAKLNLYQCLAVAGPHYEDVFCLGQHAMIDTAQCVAEATGDKGPAAATTLARRASGVSIPVGSAH